MEEALEWMLDMKSAVTPFGSTYAYIYRPASDLNKPTLLFLHGFLETSYDWRFQIDRFASLGYGILAPDLLGFGQTSKPSDVYEYRLKKIGEEVICLLRKNRIAKVIGIGHDLGCLLLCSLAEHFPDRLLAHVFMGTCDKPATSNSSKHQPEIRAVGTLRDHTALGCYQFLVSDKAASSILGASVDSVLSLFYNAGGRPHWEKNVDAPGAAKHWLESGCVTEFPRWMSAEILEAKRVILSSSSFVGPILWFKAAQVDMSKGGRAANLPCSNGFVAKPTLLIDGQQDDFSCLMASRNSSLPWIKGMRIRYVDAGHWMMLQDPHSVNSALEEFLQDIHAIDDEE